MSLGKSSWKIYDGPIGKIALLGNNLVKIRRLDYEEKTVKKKVGGTLFKPIYEENKILSLKRVWWSYIYDQTEQLHSKGWGTESYDWYQMIADAENLIKQVKLIT